MAILNVESRILNVQVPRASGATDTQLRQRRRKFCTFYIQNSKFYIFEPQFCADFLIMPTRKASINMPVPVTPGTGMEIPSGHGTSVPRNTESGGNVEPTLWASANSPACSRFSGETLGFG